MDKDTLTIELAGDISLEIFSKAVNDFYSLVRQLSEEVVGPNKIRWEIAKLEGGSAATTIRGQSSEIKDVEKVVYAYTIIGQALEMDRAIPFSKEVVDSTYSLISVLNGDVTAVNFVTDYASTTLVEPIFKEPQAGIDYSLGVIKGRVSAIWIKPLKLAVTDALFNRVVYCFLEAEDRSIARDVWGKMVEVQGFIRRDSETGRPIDVRRVSKVRLVEKSDPKSYRLAKGIIPWKVGTESAEQIVRRLSNG